MYTSDNNDLLGLQIGNSSAWIDFMAKNGYMSSTTAPNEAVCPGRVSFKFKCKYCTLGSRMSTGHSYSGIFSSLPSSSGNYSDSFMNYGLVKAPSSFFLIGDSYKTTTGHFHDNNYQSSYVYATSTTQCTYTTGAHNGNGNFGFIDGHAAAVNSPSALCDMYSEEWKARGSSYTGKFYVFNKDNVFQQVK